MFVTRRNYDSDFAVAARGNTAATHAELRLVAVIRKPNAMECEWRLCAAVIQAIKLATHRPRSLDHVVAAVASITAVRELSSQG
jgi:hypothetical protein